MIVTKAEIADALGVSETGLDRLVSLIREFEDLDTNPELPDAEQTIEGIILAGGSFGILNAASRAAGGTGFSMTSMAVGVAIVSTEAQIIGAGEEIAHRRALAVAANAADELVAQAKSRDLSDLKRNLAQDAQTLVAGATLEAQISGNRAEQVRRRDEAEAFAQAVSPIVESLKVRRRRIATGDLTAV